MPRGNIHRNYVKGGWYVKIVSADGETMRFFSLNAIGRKFGFSGNTIRQYFTGGYGGRSRKNGKWYGKRNVTADGYARCRLALDECMTHYEIERMPEDLPDDVRRNVMELQEFRNRSWEDGTLGPESWKKERRKTVHRWVVEMEFVNGRKETFRTLKGMGDAIGTKPETVRCYLLGHYGASGRETDGRYDTTVANCRERNVKTLDECLRHYEIIDMPAGVCRKYRRNAAELQEFRNGAWAEGGQPCVRKRPSAPLKKNEEKNKKPEHRDIMMEDRKRHSVKKKENSNHGNI